MRHFKCGISELKSLIKGFSTAHDFLSEKSPVTIMKLSSIIYSIALACTVMTVTVSGMITNRNTDSLELNEETNQEKVLNVKGLCFDTKGRKKLPKGRGQRRAGFAKNREFKKEAKNKRTKYNVYSGDNGYYPEDDQSSVVIFNDTGDHFTMSSN